MTNSEKALWAAMMELKPDDKLLQIMKAPPLVQEVSKIVFKDRAFLLGAGGLVSMKREDAEAQIKARGGVVKGAMTGNVDYFVCPDDAKKTSNKYRAAVKQKKVIVTESELLKAFKDNP
jgi:NAD-dependent DNA ligase